jgi:hypothetical protein
VPGTNVRVVGSGFTTFNYKGLPLAWLESVHDDGQSAIADNGGQPVEPIISLGDRYPKEIATTHVLGMGTFSMIIRELWNAPVWHQLQGLEGTNDIVEVYEALERSQEDLTCQMIIIPPNGPPRGKTYHNCIITQIDDTETITIAGMSVPRKIDVAYTHTKRF